MLVTWTSLSDTLQERALRPYKTGLQHVATVTPFGLPELHPLR